MPLTGETANAAEDADGEARPPAAYTIRRRQHRQIWGFRLEALLLGTLSLVGTLWTIWGLLAR